MEEFWPDEPLFEIVLEFVEQISLLAVFIDNSSRHKGLILNQKRTQALAILLINWMEGISKRLEPETTEN